MRIIRAGLEGFRSYESCDFVPCAGVNVLMGDNGQGKTNLLEALYLCCAGRSHRTRRDRELIRWGADFARVKVEALRRDGTHEVEIVLPSADKRRVKISGSLASRSGELMGHVSGVLFSPEDLRNVKDGPEERRRMIDMTLSQLKPSYYYALQRYNRALKQRGECLRGMENRQSLRGTLDAWDEQLCAVGSEIMRARSAYITLLAQHARQTYREISGAREALDVKYLPCVSRGDTQEDIRCALLASRDADLRRLTTSVGPHRDELMLAIDGRELRSFGSQGQQRTAALALRLAELAVMRAQLGEAPLLMLDDVMSELDPARRRALIAQLEGIQTIISCTDPEDLAGAEIGASFRVKNGALEQL